MVEASYNSPLGQLAAPVVGAIAQGIGALGNLAANGIGSLIYPAEEMPDFTVLPQTDPLGNRYNLVVPRVNLNTPLDFRPPPIADPEVLDDVFDVVNGLANLYLLRMPCKKFAPKLATTMPPYGLDYALKALKSKNDKIAFIYNPKTGELAFGKNHNPLLDKLGVRDVEQAVWGEYAAASQ